MKKGAVHQKAGTVAFFMGLAALVLLASCDRSAPKIEVQEKTVDRIVLNSGGMIQGKIVEETETQVRIQWQGSVVGFHRNEIDRIERGARSDAKTEINGGVYVPTFISDALDEDEWPDHIDHFVYLNNGERLGGRIVRLGESMLTVRQTFEEGGAIEHDLEMDRVERIALWPPYRGESTERLSLYREKYPQLELTTKGYYTVLSSEQDPADMKRFLRNLQQFHYEFMIKYFPLFDLSRSLGPLDVMVFGTRAEFDIVLAEIGYNLRSNPIGFYHFNAEKLVFYNAKTDFGVQVGLAQMRSEQQRLDQLQVQYGPRGDMEQVKEETARQELQLMASVGSRNIHVIRHEGGHQLFHVLGVTPLEVYAGGWLIEGLAVYCEPSPIGGLHQEKLMLLRYEFEKGDLMPLDYLLNFARGTGFHSMDPLYANVAYAQSWVFIYFLMEQGYRERFFNFLVEMRTKDEAYDAFAEKVLLEKHLGKTLKEIEAEFYPYVKKLTETTVDEAAYSDYRYAVIKSQ